MEKLLIRRSKQRKIIVLTMNWQASPFFNGWVVYLNGRNAGFDQPSPGRPDHLILLIANMVKWSIKIGRRWSLMLACPNIYN